MRRIAYFLVAVFTIVSCSKEKKKEVVVPEIKEEIKKPLIKFGYNLDNYFIVKDTVKNGDSFGQILDENGVEYPVINKIAENIKEVFDVRKLRAGKEYTILKSKDSSQTASVFIYHQDKINHKIIHFKDTIKASDFKKQIKIVEKTASGQIESSLSKAIDDQGLSYVVSNELSDIYAWTINFFALKKGDKFKIVYEEKFIDDTIYAGMGEIKAAYFEHGGKPFYAFNYMPDSTKRYTEYYDEEATNLRRAFLKAPLKFSRISSRYNLRRRIAYYGNKIRPHYGTDFAAPIGTPIMSTANGVVVKSERRGGNGNYVKVKHNATYSTQYLHMKSRAVKVGDVVKQGDVIGYVGMTGNTSGPHVCYRFWKHGKQVDPLREKLPAADPLKDSLRKPYFHYIKPFKEKLDSITFEKEVLEFAELK
ncbi:M23 family metallopeptidase [Aureivirga sp. CE67]|uniref:M23 family metallopeptidase n=1 Tax=Aureivirga sp. CE67 TaxID=1788983 RepID=UPI0018CB5731|nr:peptidoglycan DD-metalloendopeptidase family protein [Aureivirga sp. CE67]